MDSRQLLSRVQNALIARRWTPSTGGLVWPASSVIVSAAPVEVLRQSRRYPLAIVVPDSSDPDTRRQASELFLERFSVVAVARQAGDQSGQGSVMGAHRIDKDTSRGRGVLEYAREVYATLEEVRIRSGVNLHTFPAAAVAVDVDAKTGILAARSLGFASVVTSYEVHHAPLGVATAESGGTVTITWDVPDDTTDLVAYVVRRSTDGQPVAFPDEGTSITPAAFPTRSATNAPGAGTFAYSVFALYADPGGSIGLHHSNFGYAAQVVP